MKHKTFKIKLSELPLMLYENSTITLDDLQKMDQFITDNSKDHLHDEFIKLNMNLSHMFFDTNEPLNAIELSFIVADPNNQIDKEEKYDSIW